MAQKIITDGNPENVYDRLQFEDDEAEREQREFVRSQELEYISQARNQTEFRAAMEAKDAYLAESPDVPLDEVSYRDYRIRRAGGEGR